MGKLNIKNYTSGTPVSLSLSKIEEYLVQAGATFITKNYSSNTKECEGIFFVFMIDNIPTQFKVIAQTEQCYNVLIEQYKRKTDSAMQTCREQAARTAWKIICDWVQIQVSMILLDQAKPAQLFLSCIYDQKNNKTLFEHFEDGKMNQLLLNQ